MSIDGRLERYQLAIGDTFGLKPLVAQQNTIGIYSRLLLQKVIRTEIKYISTEIYATVQTDQIITNKLIIIRFIPSFQSAIEQILFAFVHYRDN